MSSVSELRKRLGEWQRNLRADQIEEARRIKQQQKARRRAIRHRDQADAQEMVHRYRESKRRLRATRDAIDQAKAAVAKLAAAVRRKEAAAGGRGRAGTIAWARRFRGRAEAPAFSNCTPFLARSYGLRCCAWCGKFAGNALESGGKVRGVQSVGILSVGMIENSAKRGRGCFTGWSWNYRTARMGDLVVIGGFGVHVGIVIGVSGGGLRTIEGNTSGPAGRGGQVAEKWRPAGACRGIAHVRY